MNKDKKGEIALVHDFLTGVGGAESVLKAINNIYQDSDVFTLLYDKKAFDKSELDWLKNKKIKASFLQKFPKFIKKRRKLLLPFMPTAIETFNLRDYSLVISSSGAFSKGIVVKSKTKHVCYMHSPLRYVWDWSHQYIEENQLKGGLKFFTRIFLSYLRLWDRASAMRPDFIIANSKYTQERIKKYYNRDSRLIYPPVEVDDFNPTKKHGGYFLTVSRLSNYKKIDLLIDSFDKLGLSLKIVGEGQAKEKLEKKIRSLKNADKIKIYSGIERKELIQFYQNCRAFVFASDEDFGIAPVEAMAAGKPVIALKSGGVLETVVEGEMGEFFGDASVEMIADAVWRFTENERNYDIEKIRKQAEKFSREKFEKKFKEFIISIK